MPHLRSALLAVVALLGSAMLPPAAPAQTPLMALRYTSDVPVELGGILVTPADLAEDDLNGSVILLDVGVVPADAHIDAYHPLGPNDILLSFDTATTLPGGVLAGPADVVRRNGGNYSILFAAADNGVPEGVNVDAVTVSQGELILSFDTSVRFDDRTFEDEDLVLFTGTGFAPFFNGSNLAALHDLDLDGAQVLGPERLLLSFDGSGSVGGVDFNDDDVLEYDGDAGTFALAYNGAAHHLDWQAGDLVAFYAILVDQMTPTPTVTTVPTTGTPTPTTATPPTATATATSTPVSTVTGTPPTATATSTPESTVTGTPPTATATSIVTPTTPSGVCVGDCNNSGEVTVNELITMVNIALGNAPVSSCLAGDPNDSGDISINELVQAVNNTLNGC